MAESFNHCPAGGIRQSRKCCTQSIHNHMVVDSLSMSSVNFAIHSAQPSEVIQRNAKRAAMIGCPQSRDR